MSDDQLTRCLKFEKKKALIIYQSDYQVTQLVYNSLHNLPEMKQSSHYASFIANGLGVKEDDIEYLTDLTCEQLKETFTQLRKEFSDLWREGKRSLLYVYVGGYGTTRDKMMQLVLNTTQKPLFNIEEACYQLCKATSDGCAVLSIFDLIDLNPQTQKQLFDATNKGKEETTGETNDLDTEGMFFCGIKRDQAVCEDKRVKFTLELLEKM